MKNYILLIILIIVLYFIYRNKEEPFYSVSYLNIILPTGFTIYDNSFAFPNNLIITTAGIRSRFRYKIKGPVYTSLTGATPPSLTFTFVAVVT
jgi:hypothetical protein